MCFNGRFSFLPSFLFSGCKKTVTRRLNWLFLTAVVVVVVIVLKMLYAILPPYIFAFTFMKKNTYGIKWMWNETRTALHLFMYSIHLTGSLSLWLVPIKLFQHNLFWLILFDERKGSIVHFEFIECILGVLVCCNCFFGMPVWVFQSLSRHQKEKQKKRKWKKKLSKHYQNFYWKEIECSTPSWILFSRTPKNGGKVLFSVSICWISRRIWNELEFHCYHELNMFLGAFLWLLITSSFHKLSSNFCEITRAVLELHLVKHARMCLKYLKESSS